MLAALGYWGFKTGNGTVTQFLLCLGTPLLVAVVWGIFLAPASSKRLRGQAHLALELVIFGLAIVALAAAGQPVLAGIFVILYLINKVLQYVWRQ